MLTVVVTDEDRQVRRMMFAGREVTIGRTRENDLVLPKGNISKQHARFVVKEGRVVVVDLKSTNGTFVNGTRITAPRLVSPADKIEMGKYQLVVEVSPEGFENDATTIDREAIITRVPPSTGRNAVETGLLEAIADRDEASRIVYADWLDEQGDHAKAEFLRLQQQLLRTPPEDMAFLAHTDRLRELASEIDVGWRFAVARPVIERCELRFQFQCPKEWGKLAPTERPDVRHCDTCKQDVHYAANMAVARQLARDGKCIVVDVVPLRRPGDLDPPPAFPPVAVRTAGMPIMPINPPPPRRVVPETPVTTPRPALPGPPKRKG